MAAASAINLKVAKEADALKTFLLGREVHALEI
jgi:hypothetical protein